MSHKVRTNVINRITGIDWRIYYDPLLLKGCTNLYENVFRVNSVQN